VGNTPEIIENFRDFEPPAHFRPIVDDLVEHVPREFLAGLQSIVLTNRLALNRGEKRRKTWSRNKRIRLADALGYYSAATRSSGAFVVLYVEALLKDWDAWYTRLPLIRYYPAIEVLYHEIGHHIHAQHRPEYKGKEDVANYWKKKLTSRFIRRRYFYLVPAIYVMGKILRVAEWMRK